MAKETPEEKAESLDRQFEESKQRAESRQPSEPAQIPDEPRGGGQRGPGKPS